MMKNKNSFIIFVIFELIGIVSAINNIQEKNWTDFWFSILLIVTLLVPYVIVFLTTRKEIHLPKRFIEFSLIFIFMALYLGELKNYYQIILWWDILLHFLSGIYVVLIALKISDNIITKEKRERISNRRYKILILLFAFSFSITFGTLWEIFEFLGDHFFNTNMVKGGLDDTATDLIAHIISGLITAIVMYFKINT
ncbi:hypothetical protein [Tissierella sp. Yu-01]|uniref:hypothetical protein n=1 Tax=Tissierella sp. Yu-01 TaxID=3035694 RepID=UPI00240D2A56|nr:hypothetical protein [Tissierella sp. Yu-01]WFA09107.1 hypothetical protein P3962_00630 [Tissierella sp. Yu-01]